MRQLSWISLVFCLSAANGIGFAQDSSSNPLASPVFFEEERGPWEFGVDWGVMVPTRKRNFSHDINNQRAYDLLAAETVGDEVGEGFIPPPLPGFSTVAASLKSLGEIGMHVYYQKNPWLAWGLDGGWGFRRDLNIDSRGIYDSRDFMVMTYRANIMHFTAPLKIGKRFGIWKPYLLVGPGLYFLQERSEISFNDADDPQLKPIGIVVNDYLYGGLNAGAGLECRVGSRGLLGLDVQYHKVFSSAYRIDFVLPKMRLAVMF